MKKQNAKRLDLIQAKPLTPQESKQIKGGSDSIGIEDVVEG